MKKADNPQICCVVGSKKTEWQRGLQENPQSSTTPTDISLVKVDLMATQSCDAAAPSASIDATVITDEMPQRDPA